VKKYGNVFTGKEGHDKSGKGEHLEIPPRGKGAQDMNGTGGISPHEKGV